MTNAYTQTQRDRKGNAKAEEISLRGRWGIKTNAVDWLLAIPNTGVRFNLDSTARNKHIISANVKWNWNTSQTYTPSLIFNVLDARVEWRQYLRTRQHGSVTKDTGLYIRLKETVFTTQRKNLRQERAYYWRVYINASDYDLKIGKEGKQGNAYGVGISVGYTAPLYGYRNNYIDSELGGSVGFLYTSYDIYIHDAESNRYPCIAGRCRGGYIVPFPLTTDLRVAFIYRFMSVGSKYKASVYCRVQIRDEKRSAINVKINAMRLYIDSIAGAVQKQGFSCPNSLLTKEELKRWRLMQQGHRGQTLKEAADRLHKCVADSLGIQLSDTLTSEQEKTIDKALKGYEKQLKWRAETQDSTKLGKRAAKDAKRAAKEKKGRKEKREPGKNKKKDGQQELKAIKKDMEAEQEEAEVPDKEKKEDKA